MRPTLADAMLRTDRLMLRPLGADDVYDFFDYMSDPVFRACGRFTPLRDLQAARRAVARRLVEHERGRVLTWSILRVGDERRMIGHVSLCSPDGGPLADAAALSYGIAPDCWGVGHATEAAGAVLAHALDALGIEACISHIHPDNRRSYRVTEKLARRFAARIAFRVEWLAQITSA